MLHAVLALALLAPLPSDPTDVQSTLHELPWLGMTVTESRWVDAKGVVQRSAVDARGRAVDISRLLVAEREARLKAHGKLSPELAQRVAAAAPDSALQVVFWLRQVEEPDLHGMLQALVRDGMSVADARQLVLQTARAVFQPANQAFAERLTAGGAEVRLVGDYWPDVFANVPVSELARFAVLPEVDAVYYAFSEGGPEQNHAQGTMRTWNTHDLGISGATGPTKVLVNDCGEVTAVHPWLPPVIKMTTNAVQSHPCGVAGNIAMNGGGYRSAAYGLPQLYSADGCGSDAPAQAAWSWGLTNGIDIGNCSWWNGNKGSIVFLDRFFDYTVRNFSVMLFKSNGNQGTSGAPTSTSPGNGYNMISVGSYTDNNNVDWSGDAMASYSSYQNPVEGHEKPELATPGDGTTSTNTTSGTQSFNGTSSASPLACGVGALVLNANPSVLASMPTLKAAMMVGAWHNVEGAAVLSDKDGAGGLHTNAAVEVVRKGHFEAASFNAGSFPGGVYDKQIDLRQGDEARIIALWFSDPNAAYSTDVLKMDVDMTVLNPTGQVVATSVNAFNPFELVQFVPAVSGAYTVRLTLQRFLGTSEPYCIAWSTRQDAAVADVTVAGTPTPGAALTTTFRSRYDASVPYIGVVSFHSQPLTVPLTNGWVLPVGADRLALNSIAKNLGGFATGFSGTLNASGTAQGTLFIPSHPLYMGVTLYVTMFTHAVGNMSAVRDTAPATTILVQ